MQEKLKIILTGATGMVGEGVLHECLQHPEIEQILVVGRRSCEIKHPKMNEIVLKDLYDLSAIENDLKNYDACFFCLGISSLSVNKEEYYKITYTLTMNFAETLSRLNPEMTFCYISGYGTGTSKMEWSKVKVKTENDLMKLPFKQVYNFRPAFMRPTKGLKHALSFYKYMDWMYPLLHMISPSYFITLKDFAYSMINATIKGYHKQILDMKDVAKLAKM